MNGLFALSKYVFKETKFKNFVASTGNCNEVSSSKDAYIPDRKIVVPKKQPEKVRNPKDAIVINYRPLHYC